MSFFSGLKKVLLGSANGRGGDSGGHGNRYKNRLPLCLKMDQDPSHHWDFVGELGDGAFGKVYKVKLI